MKLNTGRGAPGGKSTERRSRAARSCASNAFRSLPAAGAAAARVWATARVRSNSRSTSNATVRACSTNCVSAADRWLWYCHQSAPAPSSMSGNATTATRATRLPVSDTPDRRNTGAPDPKFPKRAAKRLPTGRRANTAFQLPDLGEGTNAG